MRSDGLKGRMARPLVVVHSGWTTIAWPGFCSTRVCKSVSCAFFGGSRHGYSKARNMAWNKEMRCTRRVDWYEAVKTGSNMAARYRESSGEV